MNDQLSDIALALAMMLPDEWKEGEEVFSLMMPLAINARDASRVPTIRINLKKNQFDYIKQNSKVFRE